MCSFHRESSLTVWFSYASKPRFAQEILPDVVSKDETSSLPPPFFFFFRLPPPFFFVFLLLSMAPRASVTGPHVLFSLPCFSPPRWACMLCTGFPSRFSWGENESQVSNFLYFWPRTTGTACLALVPGTQPGPFAKARRPDTQIPPPFPCHLPTLW